MRSPASGKLFALWAETYADVDVVGEGGTYLHYDGFEWKQSEQFSQLTGVANAVGVWRGRDGAEYVATGDGDILRTTTSGGLWEKVAATGKTLTGISGSAGRIVAVGLAGAIVEYDGTSASLVTPPLASYPMNSVWIDSNGDGYAVGARGGIMRRSGGTWTVDRNPLSTEPELFSVWGRAANDVWAVGAPPLSNAMAPTILHNNGSGWSPIVPGTISPFTLYSVAGSDAEIWCAGEKGALVHFDGSSWEPLTTGAGTDLFGIAAGRRETGNDLFAVGAAGRILRFTGP